MTELTEAFFFFDMARLPRAIFFMNHTLQFVKCQQQHKRNETPASSRWFCCYSQLHSHVLAR